MLHKLTLDVSEVFTPCESSQVGQRIPFGYRFLNDHLAPFINTDNASSVCQIATANGDFSFHDTPWVVLVDTPPLDSLKEVGKNS